MNTELAIRAWQDALLVSQLIAVDPHGFGGVWVKSYASDVRSHWWQYTQSLFHSSEVQTVPANVDDDALLGGIDLTKTLAQGLPVYQKGILEKSTLRLLKLSMAERFRSSSVSYISQAFDQPSCGFGIVLFDESTPEEDGAASKLIDRCAFQIRLDAISYFLIEQFEDLDMASIDEARVLYQKLIITDAMIESITQTAQALGVESFRSLLQVVKAARGIAALRLASVVEIEDIQIAIRLVFTHRITHIPASNQEPEQLEEDMDDEDEPESNEEVHSQEEDNPPPDTSNEDLTKDTEIPQEVLQDILIDAAKAYLPQDLLDSITSQQKLTKSATENQGKEGDRQLSFTRGTPLPSRKGILRSGQKIDFIKTLQVASPWQKLRQREIVQPRIAFKIQPEDIHIKRFQQRKTTLTLFVVDASGSTALERLAEAKGAVELLLANCYVRRDQVALMTFRINQAELVLPPTRSLVRAKRLLNMMAGGGGTPLALAIDRAGQFLDDVKRHGHTPTMILITDARANVSLAGVGGREKAFSDATQVAQAFRSRGIKSILIDTAIMPQENAKVFANSLGSIYVPLPMGRADKVVQVAKQFSN